MLKSGPLLSVGVACSLTALFLLHMTVFLQQLHTMSGINLVNEDNDVVIYIAPVFMWAMPVMLLIVGVALLVMHVRSTTTRTPVEQEV